MGLFRSLLNYLFSNNYNYSKKYGHRNIREEGDKCIKSGKIHEAYCLYEKAYKQSLLEPLSSISVIKKLVRTAHMLNDSKSVNMWLNELDKQSKKESRGEYSFERIQVLISINNVDEAIVELNKSDLRSMSLFDIHKMHGYYVRCYKKLKLYKTAIHNYMLKNIYLAKHYNSINNFHASLRGDSQTGEFSDLFHEKMEKELLSLFKRANYSIQYKDYKNKILGIIDKSLYNSRVLSNSVNEKLAQYIKEAM
ncbi:MAG: hypothetical protein HQ528_00515 [Candidatus Marinimicrobia bacterium]|nr:hypothetical protein [Candidatus Neomarinimicrobiota bacterium]